MTHFIYCPKSGDRVFAVTQSSEIAVVCHGNGSRTVVGGCCLSWQTAMPGKHWRAAARQMAKAIVEGCGGIAWDEQGVVSIIVPAGAARRAAALMIAASGGVEKGLSAVATAALVGAGCQLDENLKLIGNGHTDLFFAGWRRDSDTSVSLQIKQVVLVTPNCWEYHDHNWMVVKDSKTGIARVDSLTEIKSAEEVLLDRRRNGC